jgi:hypothetical protein
MLRSRLKLSRRKKSTYKPKRRKPENGMWNMKVFLHQLIAPTLQARAR